MHRNYIPSDQNGNLFFNGLFGLLLVCGIFLILPIMHALAGLGSNQPKRIDTDSSLQPPPPPPDEPPPPPDKQEELEKPEVEEPPPPMTLAQLEMALNPGSGDAVGDYGFGDFKDVNLEEDFQIFDLKDLDKKPRPLFQVEPNYPYSLQQAQIEGWCMVEFVIDDNGNVRRARAYKSSHREFEQPAIDSIMRSRFEPGRKDGKNVATRVRQRIDFKL